MSTRRKKNILLVDDDPFLLSLYSKTLEREGFNVLTAPDGVAALQKLPEQPDLVVLDLMLPKLDGMKVLEAIRKGSQHTDLPILILSNAYLPEVAREAMAAGATAGILKSECSPKRLVGIIRDTLKSIPAPTEGDKQPAARNSWLPSRLWNKGGNSEPGPATRAAQSYMEDESGDEPAVSPEFQNELQKSWPTEIAMIRGVCLKYAKAAGGPESEEYLKEIHRRLRLVGARSAMAEWFRISQLSGALEAMLFEHGFKDGKTISQSAIQTMFQAVDCLEHLFKTGRSASIQSTQNIRVLLVDDDPVCNKANDLALKRVSIDTVCVGEGDAALALLEKTVFDLILLDVEMPGANGFEVCKKLRKLPLCKDTPVIFVTIKDDFQSRAQSVLCGGNSLISKPISALELIVRTLIFLLRPQNGKPSGEQVVPATVQKPSAGQNNAAAPAQKAASQPAKQLDAAQVAVDEKVKALTEALAAETKRRETAEQLAAEQARIQRKLEDDHAENQQAQVRLQQMLEESRQQNQNGEPGQPAQLDGRTRALLAVQDFMEDKSKKLTKKLAEQAVEAKSANEQAAECAKRMGDFESSLAAIRKAKDSLLQELQAAGNGAHRTELESAIAENQRSQESLVQKIEATWQEFEAHQLEEAAGQSPMEAKAQELEASLAAVEEKVNSLTQALTAEKERSETAEQKAAEINQRRAALETELAASSTAQEQLRAQLEEQQKKLDGQVQAHQTELGQLAGRTKELEICRADVEEKVKTLTEALAAEAKRSETAEQQAAEVDERRNALEAELASSKQAQARLREQMAEQQKQLDAQVQTHNAEVGNLADRTKELEAGRAAMESKVQALTQALAAETKRSETAEQQATDVNQRRSTLEAELTASSQAQGQLRAQLAEQQQKLEAQIQAHQADLGQLAERTKELEANRLTVDEQVKSLTQALAAETKRSETAEQQASEIGQRRGALEAELAASNQTQAQLRDQLTQQQQKLDAQIQAHQAEVGNLAGRTKELETGRAQVEETVKSLTQALAAETKKSENAEQRISEINERRNAIESELAASNQAQAQLQARLAEQDQKLETQVQAHKVELGNFSGRTKELETSCSALEDKISSLTKNLAAEAKRSEKAEQKASEINDRRNALESELAASNEAKTQLRNQLAEQQKLMESQGQADQVEFGKLAARIKELETNCEALEEKIKSLTKALAAEAKKSEKAEQKAAEINERRSALEKELAASNQAQTELRAQFAELQQKFDAQVQVHQLELAKLGGQTKGFEADRAALEEKIKSLTDTLAAETRRSERAEQLSSDIAQRRNALESELAASNQAQEQMRAQLAEQQKRLDSEVHTHHVQIDSLAGKTKELEAVRLAVEEKVKSLTQTLAQETQRSETAERQVAEVNQRRAALESELAAGSQLQAQLQAQIAEQTKQFETQVEKHRVELGELTGRAAQVQESHAAVQEKVKSLSHALETETKRSETAGQQVAELTRRRTALETELAASSQAQSQLRAQLAEQQQQLQARVQTDQAEFSKLAAQTRNLETTRAIQEEKINALTQALSVELKRSESAAEQSAETDKRRNALQAELAASTEAQARLIAQITEQQQQLHLVSAELEGFRRCAQDEALRHTQMAGQIEQSEKTLAELAAQLDSARSLASSREDAINALNLEMQKHRDAHERLDVSLKGEVAHRQKIETQMTSVRTQMEETSRQLAQKCTAEQGWLARESELQGLIHGQQDELAKSKATLASQELDLKNARIKVEESQILQTVLCAKIQVLADQGQSAAKAIQELEAKAARSGLSDKQLAGLRYAVLDASRMSAKLHLERFKMERQNLDAMRKFLSSLLQTPLSMAQRGMIAEVQNSMDGFDNIRAVAAQVASCPVEMPNFQSSEFSLAEVMESAFTSVRAGAKAAGVAVQASMSGTDSGQVVGYAEHLHQLIMLLAVSPLTILPGINACNLRAETKSGSGKPAEIILRVGFSTDGNAEDLLSRFNSVTAAVLAPQTTSFNEAEFGLAAGWQLAMAMGAQPSIEAVGAKQVCLTLSLTLETESSSPAEKAPSKAQAQKNESSGNGQHTRKAKPGAKHKDESCAVTE